MKREGKILVECLYATAYNDGSKTLSRERGSQMNFDYWSETCNPYIDTLDGRRQADVIEDWLITANGYNYKDGELLWAESIKYVDNNMNPHQYRLDRIKWCIEQMDNR